jgi:zinc ribbon protein
MSGLLRRLTRRRPATADETRSPTPESSEPAGAPAETPAEPGGGQPLPEEQATQVLPATTQQPAVPEQPPAAEPTPQPAPVRDLPAGIDPGELAVGPAASASRGKLRRRLRYLRRARELLLRDLGGFIFEIHRSAGDTPQEGQRRLVESKVNRIDALDSEVRGLEARLGEPHAGALLREPGIGGVCPECGELHASDAHYCSRCGAPLDAKARAKRDAAAAQPATGAQPAAEPAPASVLWAAGPHPRAQPDEQEKEKTDPSAATSQWLAIPRPAEAAATPPSPTDEPAPAAQAPAAADEPATAGDDAAGNEPTTTANEVAPAADPPAADEAPTTTNEVTAGDEAAAQPKPATRAPREEPAAENKGADFEPAPNGRKDEDVPSPLPDPLSSRREQGS